MRVVVINHVTLDGVMQAPGRADEDTRGGFAYGGWADRGNDEAMGASMTEHMGTGFSWLFGRITYEGLLSHWNEVGGPMADGLVPANEPKLLAAGLNGATKYVASSSPDTELAWPNSVLVTGDVPARIAQIRAQPGGNLVVLGSGRLLQSLLSDNLVDELHLFIHPVTVGSGLRLFAGKDHAHRFSLVDASPFSTGVIAATYEPA